MTDVAYDGLADVYDWLVPEALLTPEGTVAAFSGLLSLPPVGRVLDSACGIGQLAVGLALQGFDVVASDASPAMVQRSWRPIAVSSCPPSPARTSALSASAIPLTPSSASATH
jgi:SAM-dependent methyltransferase